jgi:type I restriction enzyme M protein
MEVANIDQTTFDLSVKNPNNGEEVKHRSPKDILDEVARLDAESASIGAYSGAVVKAAWKVLNGWRNSQTGIWQAT